MIEIYCGTGKGKTTAALGLSMRAAGAGMRVLFVQLMKGRETSELASLRTLGIEVRRCDRDYGFSFRMSGDDRIAITECHDRLLSGALEAMQQRTADLIVIDELFSAYNTGLLDKKQAQRLVQECPPEMELVLTGRGPDAVFLAAADYISEIQAVRHPFEKGITARKGIEY